MVGIIAEQLTFRAFVFPWIIQDSMGRRFKRGRLGKNPHAEFPNWVIFWWEYFYRDEFSNLPLCFFFLICSYFFPKWSLLKLEYWSFLTGDCALNTVFQKESNKVCEYNFPFTFFLFCIYLEKGKFALELVYKGDDRFTDTHFSILSKI